MSIESGVYTILSTNAGLAATFGVPLEDLPGLVYRAGAVMDPPDSFLAIRWEENPTPQAFLTTQNMTLRAHHRDQSYDLVDALLDECKRILVAVAHQHGVTQLDWRGRSPDLFDDSYRTVTRYDTYSVAGGLTSGRT